ncbi:hypothetical protein PPL_00281 [Heterostelium album PN500]|uniref:Uncharacterized protein n=1 Tax=Heterostelium pallidum (strain ATCC 26659 / Pp 5 / PN500) TaxID=670386 RepID=D3AW14_HETP5|nr:hypothetical protein PPL_00281 [Heterostelium album PN500]EFA86487.1 hypothetical protein PPL_00281 [Heterostelium album PN500]|eukprot:XP_020438592.1 hypothetical protein PPL_00281 [Heterostelium album PN500]
MVGEIFVCQSTQIYCQPKHLPTKTQFTLNKPNNHQPHLPKFDNNIKITDNHHHQLHIIKSKSNPPTPINLQLILSYFYN